MNTKDATFAIYRDMEEIKVVIHSFLKLGFNKSALLVYQSKLQGSKDFSQAQKNQSKNGAFIGCILGVILFGSFFTFIYGITASHRWLIILVGLLVGGIFGAGAGLLVGIGTPDRAARRYGQYLQAGGILFSVHSDNPRQVHQAQEILTATGGQDIQLINEIKTWAKANLERIDLDKLQTEIE